MCDCADGFSGANCESEYIVRRGKSRGCRIPGEEDKPIMVIAVDIFDALFEMHQSTFLVPVIVGLVILTHLTAEYRIMQR